jgi:beta-galactosidase
MKRLGGVDLNDKEVVKAKLEAFIAEMQAKKNDPGANSGYYITTARTYLKESGNEVTMRVRIQAIEDEIYAINKPQSHSPGEIRRSSSCLQPMNKLLLALVVAFAPMLSAIGDASPRGRLSLNKGWLFHQGDIPFPEVTGHTMTYQSAKAGAALGAAAQAFDDTGWSEVDLPHDWASHSPISKYANIAQGYRERGFGWYRRHFQVDPADRGKHFELQFDGVSTHCTVWVNGTVVHRNWCGYTSFSADITPLLKYGDEFNSVAVRVDAEAQEGWWYEGAGIYRHTWLVKRSPVHIVTDGVFTQPLRAPDGKWSIPAEVTIANSGGKHAKPKVEVTLLDPEGKPVGTASQSCEVAALGGATAKLTLAVKNPRLWSVDSPTMYSVKTVLKDGDSVLDETVTPAGFRTLRFDAATGFYLNDKPLKIQGVCVHQEHAGVGVAMPDSMWEFRVRKLKEMGVNAIRCSHHPPAAEFLQVCDRLGMLVMDEARNFKTSPEYIRQLEWMVRRDRNHPSVFMWSVFNEEPFQGTEVGYEMTRRLVAAVKRLDTTRPVTAAMSGGYLTPLNVSHAVDVMGFNYHQKEYDAFHKLYPNLPILRSEDTSGFITRGEYESNMEKQTADSRDTYAARWGATHRDGWKKIAERPFIAGGFVWTGFDYAGEPTPFEWPSASSSSGIYDLCGFPKSAFFIHQAHWRKDKDVLEVIPHWNWPGREGQSIRVMALSNADTVELFLNGKSLGEKPVDPIDMVEWDVTYEPGVLLAVGKKHGCEVSRKLVETTGDADSLELVPDRNTISGDGRDAMPVTVRAVDAKGREVPTAMNPVKFSLQGGADIIGLGNGDPRCHEPQKGNQRSLFNGLAQVILQTREGASGSLTLRAESAGLAPAELKIPIRAAPSPPSFPTARYEQRIERGWKASPGFASKPDPLIKFDSNDMNTWATVTPGTPLVRSGGPWSAFSASFEPFANMQRDGGVLAFRGILGKAEVWIDGKLAATKAEFDDPPLVAPFLSGNTKRSVRILFESDADKPVGFTAPISVVPAVPKAFNAQGEMVGEVTPNSALLQSRLTAIPGPELDADGDIPGIAGQARFEWSEYENFTKSQLTPSIEAQADSDFIIRSRLADLQPGTRYFYRLVFEDGRKGATRSFKTLDPEAKGVSFTIGSCMNYLAFTTGVSNGGGPVTASEEDKQLGYPSFVAMQKLNPDFFIGAGDVVYYSFPLDAPAKTLPGMRKKWHEQFRFPRMAEFFTSTPTYWLKDDHDFRFDDADQSGDKPPLASTGMSIFREQMPIHPAGDQSTPNYRTLRISKDVQLWFLEGRDHRSDNKSLDGPAKSLWGAAQREWLERTLAASAAKWKILISPTPMVGPDRASKSDNHTNHAGFRAEADSFFAWLQKKDIKNVLILCGDRHWQYHSVHPTGVEEFSVGALNDENSIKGLKPGDPKSTDPDSLVKQLYQYTEPTGGFVHVTANPDSTLKIQFFDDRGVPLHELTKK